MRNLIEELRQRRFPPEFRIAGPVWPEELAGRLAELARALSAGAPAPGREHEHDALLAEVGTGLWRLRQRMVDGGGQPLEPFRRVYRHLESTWDALAQAGVLIQDHTGDAFDAGQSLKVIAFQPTAGLERETVIETIRPSVYRQRRPLQMGEVIVGTPGPRSG
jgi:hypothetical protein